MTIRCRHAKAGFELGSPDYQEKVLSTTPVRDHQFKVILVELYVVPPQYCLHCTLPHNIPEDVLNAICTYLYLRILM
jgi:hypothetical protein